MTGQMLGVSLPNDPPTRLNIGRLRRKRNPLARPLGMILILGGLGLLGLLAKLTGPQRAPWVWSDFHKIQGTYTGNYFQRGKNYLALQTKTGIFPIAVDQKITFRYLPEPGSEVQVTYTNPQHPTVVREDDVRVVYLPDPDHPGQATQYRSP